LVREYEAEGKLVYIQDVTFDAAGQPVVMYVVSSDAKPGPQTPARAWWIARFDATKKDWIYSKITESTHNYDVGALYVEADGTWRIIGPTEEGPQKWGSGGEIAMWASADQGATWKKIKQMTEKSPRNHGYVRRPVGAKDDFYGIWADGNADKFSESILYFCNKSGDVFKMPPVMEGDVARPERVSK